MSGKRLTWNKHIREIHSADKGMNVYNINNQKYTFDEDKISWLTEYGVPSLKSFIVVVNGVLISTCSFGEAQGGLFFI